MHDFIGEGFQCKKHISRHLIITFDQADNISNLLPVFLIDL